MALSATVLSAAMRSAILAAPEVQAIDGVALTKLCDAIASTVVAHITANASVAVNTVTTCPAGAGTGVGTGTVA